MKTFKFLMWCLILGIIVDLLDILLKTIGIYCVNIYAFTCGLFFSLWYINKYKLQ